MKKPLVYTHPKLAEEWHPTKNKINPSAVLSGSDKKAWWICKEGHEWEASICNRSAGRGCPYCSNRRVGYGNDLSSVNPELSAEWHPSNNNKPPSEYLPFSNKKVWWLCKEGHEWEASIGNRSQGRGCPYCAKKSVFPH